LVISRGVVAVTRSLKDGSTVHCNPGETQFDDLECRDPLHTGGAGYADGFVGLNLGLEPRRKRPPHRGWWSMILSKDQYPPGQNPMAGSSEIVL
jgi:hypothetical protein